MCKRTVLFLFCCLFFGAKLFSQNADIDLLKRINPNDPGASFFWKTTSASVYPITAGVQGGFLLYDYFKSDSSRKQLLPRIAAKLAVVIITEGIKLGVNRTRPYISYPSDIHPYGSTETGMSFPSAHTSLAFNTAAAVSMRFNKWYITVPAYVWAASAGYSRLYLGVHYPTDVIAGAIVGVGSAYLSRWLERKIKKAGTRHTTVQ